MNRLVLVGLLALAPTLALAKPPDPSGVWMRGDGNARVRIAPCGGGNICAVNLWIGDPSSGEAVGDRLVLTLSEKNAQTLEGSAYDPQRKLTYSMTMRVEPDQLQTKGCVLGQLLCKSVSWSRVD